MIFLSFSEQFEHFSFSALEVTVMVFSSDLRSYSFLAYWLALRLALNSCSMFLRLGSDSYTWFSLSSRRCSGF